MLLEIDIPVAQIEAVVEPACVADDIGQESVTLVCLHTQILAVSAF
jgi:hypothetical protein